jgi:hypothetical protein
MRFAVEGADFAVEAIDFALEALDLGDNPSKQR